MEAVLDYSKILDTVPCGICQVLVDTDLTMLYANQFYYKIYGYTPQSAKEKGFLNAKFILPESDYLYIKREVFQHIRNGDREFQLEYRAEHSSGKLMWLLVRCFYDPEQPDRMTCALVDIADRKEMEEKLRISSEESRIAYQLTDKLMYIYDAEKKQLHQPKAAADEFGLPPVVDDAPYSIVKSGAIDGPCKKEYIEFYEAILRGEPNGHAAVKKRRKNGSFGWYEAKFSSIYDENGNVKKAVISCEDITEQREKELSYQKWSQYFKSQEGKTIGFYEYNLTKDLFDEEAGDLPPDYLRPLKKYTQTVQYIADHFVYEGDAERFSDFFDRDSLLVRYYKGQTRGSMDYLRKRPDGSLFWVRAIILLLADPYSDNVRLFMMTLDIDKEKREELKLRSQTEHDGMTGLLNRETFVAKVTRILGEEGSANKHALIMLDIDRFKTHNDVHGHPFGDQVIRETAHFIKGFLRESDLCGRMGGDEFMVLLRNIGSEDDVIPRINMLCHLLRRKYTDKGEVSCSMGVVFYPRDGKTFRELYQNADTALYEVKNTERGNYGIYKPER